ncbi:MAG: helix-turn-helix transcriptional regulator [Pseudoflavonifractor sp.]
MSTEFEFAQAYAWGRIFRIAADAARPEYIIHGTERKYNPRNGANSAEMQNASLFPARFVPQMIMLAQKLHRITPQIDRQLVELYKDIDLDSILENGDKPLTLNLKGSFQLGYMKGADGLFDLTKLATARKASGMTQASFAEAVGTDQRSVSRWERGTFTPRPEMLSKMAQVLNCAMEDLI